VSFEAKAGATYYIAVGDVGGLRENTFTLNLGAEALTVISVSPRDRATGVSRSTNVTATFSEEVDEETLTASTVTLVRAGTTTPIPATVTLSPDGKTVTLDPSVNLARRTTYEARIVGRGDGDGLAVRDKAGNELALDFTSSFRTRRR
jgi:hypothetical protein